MKVNLCHCLNSFVQDCRPFNQIQVTVVLLFVVSTFHMTSLIALVSLHSKIRVMLSSQINPEELSCVLIQRFSFGFHH